MSAFLSKYGVARHIYIPVIKRAVVDFAVGADWTPAAGDVKISKDGGAAANVTNLPTAIAMGNGAIWDFSLTATEMQAAQIVVTVADSATKAVEDQAFVVETFGNASAQLGAMDFTDGVRAGLTALPNAAAGANTGLPVVGTQVPNATAGAANGLLISGSNSGTTTLAALTVTGTLTVSDGISVTRSSANSSAVTLTGNGTGHGLSVTSGAGATGNGLNVTSSATNGHAVNLAGAGTGDGLKTAGGTTGHGIDAIGGSAAAAGDGLKASVLGTGVPIRGDHTANITGNLSGSVGSVTGSVGSVTGAVGSVTGNVGGNVTGSVGSIAAGGIVNASFAADAITAAVTDSTFDNSIADALLDRPNGIETGLTVRQAHRLLAAGIAGVLSGASTTTVTILGAGVVTTRIVATVDANGNRSALTLTP